MTYDVANDVVVLNRHHAENPAELGLWIYDPTTNTWDAKARAPEGGKGWKGQVNAFYDPVQNVHVYHVAGDSEPGGVIRVYRWKAKH